jgi:cysteine desulfurase
MDVRAVSSDTVRGTPSSLGLEFYKLDSGGYYFDNAAFRLVWPELKLVWNDWFIEFQGNPSSQHKRGKELKSKWNLELGMLAEALSVAEEQIIQVSSSTEAINQFLKSFLFQDSTRKKFVLPENEHKATTAVVNWLEQFGFRSVLVPLSASGIIDEEVLLDAIDEETCCVIVSHVNSETGHLLDISKIGQVCEAFGAKFFVDATQAVGKHPISYWDHGVDAFCFSSQKIGAGSGTGYLVLRKPHSIQPLIHGGGQQDGLRSGSLNLVGLMSTRLALGLTLSTMPPEFAEIRELIRGLVGLENCHLQLSKSIGVSLSPWIHLVSFNGEALAVSQKIFLLSEGTACLSGLSKTPKAYQLMSRSLSTVYRLSL